MKYPIELKAQPGTWRIYTARKSDKAFLAFEKKVLIRDRYTCQFCGFQARDSRSTSTYPRLLSRMTAAIKTMTAATAAGTQGGGAIVSGISSGGTFADDQDTAADLAPLVRAL